MKSVYIVFSLLIVMFVTACASAQENLPRLKQATFVETYSPSEVTLRATGLGDNVDEAEMDAKKSAVYYVLFGMTDKLLQTDAERAGFVAIQSKFFKDENINQYVPFMGKDILSRVKTSDGLKVEKLIRVNKEKLLADLTSQGIMADRSQTAAAAGNPIIMVVPEVTTPDTNPVDLLRADESINHAARVIESFLTARKYDVQVPEQSQLIGDVSDMQAAMKGVDDDPAHKLALSLGSDVYITYSIKVEAGKANSKRAVVNCRAYETTTARLLGTETGYSPERVSVTDNAVIEEAMNGAIDNVLSRINAYWKDDAVRGQQYKILFKITGKFDDPYVISDAIDDVLKSITSQRKQNVVTDKTIDYLVWQKNFDNSSRFFRELSKGLDANKDFKSARAKLKRLNINKKLMLLSIENV